MPLPELIEIVPPTKPVQALITIPGSKSITNRALILAALAEGSTTLRGALWSDDTRVMVACLQKLGFTLQVVADPAESCNRTITVQGLAGRVPLGGTEAQPLELFVGNAGTTARFLAALVCLGEGVYRLHGEPRMHERPQAELFAALRELGYRIESPNDRLPAVIHGQGPRPAKCRVSVESSSQFASALLLVAGRGGWSVEVLGRNSEELPYVRMTSELIGIFPLARGRFQIEPDASSGSYFCGAAWLLKRLQFREGDLQRTTLQDLRLASLRNNVIGAASPLDIKVMAWPTTDWQVDAAFPNFFSPKNNPPAVISRETELGDSIMTAVVLAPLNRGLIPATAPRLSVLKEVLLPVKFTHLGRLRLQECERVAALRTELTRCGVKVVEEEDTLSVYPSEVHGAEIETYSDHRMAMCFATLGLRVPGIRIRNPACVKKTFPNFFQKLAAPPPQGLGVQILDAASQRALALEELFAD